MARKDLTRNVDESEPIILAPKKITPSRYVTVGEDSRIAGVKIEGYAYAIEQHPTNPEKFTRAPKPLTKFYTLSIWDAFAGDLLEYEQKELKRDNKELAFLVGRAGYIKLYDGTYTVSKDQVEQVTTTILPETEGRRVGIDEEFLDEEENSLSI